MIDKLEQQSFVQNKDLDRHKVRRKIIPAMNDMKPIWYCFRAYQNAVDKGLGENCQMQEFRMQNFHVFNWFGSNILSSRLEKFLLRILNCLVDYLLILRQKCFNIRILEQFIIIYVNISIDAATRFFSLTASLY